MLHANKTLVLALVAAVMTAVPCMAQDVQPPFTWQGQGTGSFIGESGIEDVDFQFELSIDEQGIVSGKTSNDDGTSEIKHVFSSEKKEYDWPGFFSRKIVIVLMFDEYGSNPMLGVLNGRILVDKFIYGEMMLTGYEAGSDTAKALGVGNSEATLIEGDELPSELTAVLKKCFPIGTVKIVGDYKKDETTALFNGKNLDGWTTYFKDANADPKSVWKVADGVISCTGNPVGFLRTKAEYSDYKLELEWKWADKPGNSGVLLRMSGEEKIWPLCMEAQLMHTKAGDFVGMGTNFNENIVKNGGPISYAPRKKDSNEKEPGGWNKYEIVCNGGTIELTVNGELQNKATGVGVRNGYIGLQSEGAPIMFRNIKLTPLR